MATWNEVHVHKGLIIHDTDKAILTRIPKKINTEEWYVWMPKSMVNNLDEKFIKFKYPDSWKFTLINEEDRYKPKDMQEKPKEITVKEFADIFKSYETSDLDDLLLDAEIEHYSKRIARSIRVLNLELQLMQEIEDLPSEIDDLINELDLSDLDLLTENINLAKVNRFNEKKE